MLAPFLDLTSGGLPWALVVPSALGSVRVAARLARVCLWVGRSRLTAGRARPGLSSRPSFRTLLATRLFTPIATEKVRTRFAFGGCRIESDKGGREILANSSATQDTCAAGGARAPNRCVGRELNGVDHAVTECLIVHSGHFGCRRCDGRGCTSPNRDYEACRPGGSSETGR